MIVKIMNRNALVIGLMSLMAFASASHAASLPQVGQVYTKAVLLDQFEMPLPPGKWEVYYSVVDQENKDFPSTKIGLLQTKGSVVSRLIYARTKRALNRKGFRAYKHCKNSEYFHSLVRINRHGLDQECWHMRAENLTTGSGTSPRETALLNYSKQKGYVLLLTAVGPRYHFANREVSVRVNYSWIPDLIYRTPKDLGRKVWLYQDWTATEVNKDTTRKIVMKQFKRFGEDFYPKVREMFFGSTNTVITSPAPQKENASNSNAAASGTNTITSEDEPNDFKSRRDN